MTGIWINPNVYRVTHVVSGRSKDVIIPGLRLLSRQELDEILCWQREKLDKELASAPKVAPTKTQRVDLGQTLMEISDSNRHRREALHGRWW